MSASAVVLVGAVLCVSVCVSDSAVPAIVLLVRWNIENAMPKRSEAHRGVPDIGLVGENDAEKANIADDWRRDRDDE